MSENKNKLMEIGWQASRKASKTFVNKQVLVANAWDKYNKAVKELRRLGEI